MNKKTYYLTNDDVKLLIVVFTVIISALLVVFIVTQQKLFAIIFLGIMVALLLFGSYALLFNSISIDFDKRILKIRSIRIRHVSFDNIKSIEVDTTFSLDPKKYCFIVFKFKDNTFLKISGYSQISNKNSVSKTKKIVQELNDVLIKTA